MTKPIADRSAGSWRWRFVILLVLSAALVLRLHGIAFGLPALLDPDELIFELGAWKMIQGGDLNPHWFGHPATTTMYVLVLVNGGTLFWGWMTGAFASLAQFAEAVFTDPGILVLPGRVAMALIGVVGVWLTWRLGDRLFGRRAGLAAALLLAASPVHVAWSQVIRSDILATLFLTATMLQALEFLRSGRRRHLVLGALFTALAIASKWPFAIAFLALLGALFLRWRRGEADLRGTLWQAVLAGGLSVVLLLCVSPYLLIDYPTLLSNLQGEAQPHHLGATGGGFFHNLWFYLSGPLWKGLGAVGVGLAILGLRGRRNRAEFWAVAGVPALAMLLVISLQDLVWERWMIPLLPVLAIAAGAGAIRAATWLMRLSRPAGAVAFPAILLATLVQPLYIVHRSATERLHDNRRMATDWVRRHVPPDATVLVEHFAFDLVPDTRLRIIFPIGTGGCFDGRALLKGRVDYRQIDALRGGNSNLDYGALPDDKTATCKADYAILTEYARYRQEAATYPVQYARYQRLIRQGRIVARFAAVPGRVGGRPEVIVVQFD